MEGKGKDKSIAERLAKENELKRIKEDNRQLKKRNHHIKESTGWKVRKLVRKPFRAFSSIMKRLVPNKKRNQLDHLEREVYDLRSQKDKLLSELETKNRMLEVMAFDHDTISQQYVKESIKLISKEPKSIDMIDAIMDSHKKVAENRKEVLDAITNQYNQIQDLEKKDLVFNKLLEAYDIGDIPEKIVRHIEEGQSRSIASFKTNLAFRSTLRNTREATADHVIDRKSVAYAFIDRLNVRRPKTTHSPYTLNELCFEAGTVIKPTHSAGGRGVYIVYAEDEIQRVKDSTIFQGYNELELKMREELMKGTVQKDQWFIEELISERVSKKPARDLKFYCFYGKVGLVLEVIRYPHLKYCWWNEENQIIHTGKYEDNLFNGIGFSEEELARVKEISSKLPIPFMRIDFLKTEDEFVFGEFTPKPGNYDELNRDTDRLLGEMYVDAEYRLFQDLLNKKEDFKDFKTIYHAFVKNVSDKERYQEEDQ